MSSRVFTFKQFALRQDKSAHKMGTDAMLLGSWINPGDAMNILDIGTGTGVLALMLAQRSEAIIDALEIDTESAAEAEYNFEHSPWSHRITCHAQSLQDYAGEGNIHYDLIVCNPPYFEPINTDKGKNTLLPSERRKTARFTSGLSFEQLADGVQKLLVAYGRFYVIIPYREADTFISVCASSGMFLSERINIRSYKNADPVRVILCFRKEKPSSLKEEELVIYDSPGQWTSQYRELTADFHTNL